MKAVILRLNSEKFQLIPELFDKFPELFEPSDLHFSLTTSLNKLVRKLKFCGINSKYQCLVFNKIN